MSETIKQWQPAQVHECHKDRHARPHTHIDVRNLDELQEDGHIPSMSLHAPLSTLKRHHLPDDTSALVIFSCLAGGRSIKAANLALQWGFTNGNY